MRTSQDDTRMYVGPQRGAHEKGSFRPRAGLHSALFTTQGVR